MEQFEVVGHISKFNRVFLPIEDNDAFTLYLDAYTRSRDLVGVGVHFRWSQPAVRLFKKAIPSAQYEHSDYTTIQTDKTAPLFRTGTVAVEWKKKQLWVLYSGLGESNYRTSLRGFKMPLREGTTIESLMVAYKLNEH